MLENNSTLKCLIADLEALKTKYSYEEKYVCTMVCQKISELVGIIKIIHKNFLNE